MTQVKKFMTRDPFIFLPTSTIWIKIGNEWKKIEPLKIPAREPETK